MRYVIDVPDYSRQKGIGWSWDSAAYLLVRAKGSTVQVVGDEVGLRCLAEILLTLAQDGVPGGAHVHLDAGLTLTDASTDLILERSTAAGDQEAKA